MPSHKCDQFAADMLSVRDEIKRETGFEVAFSLPQVNKMVRTISHLSKATMEHAELKASVMGGYNFSNDYEETAYERLMDRIYQRRLAHAA